MKKLFYALACTLMVMALPACNTDTDDDNLPANEKIIGTWKQYHTTFTEKVDDKVVNSGSMDMPEEYAWIWTFNADGSFVITVEGDSQNGTWKIESNQLIMNYHDGGVDKCTIKSISSSKLVIQGVSDGGSVANSLVYIEYSFSKQK